MLVSEAIADFRDYARAELGYTKRRSSVSTPNTGAGPS
jgi:hypothetical protein